MSRTTACRWREVVLLRGLGVALVAACAACCSPALAQQAEPPAPPDVIVHGRAFAELRLQIRLAEEAVFARFNEINSTDDFDIHCREESRAGTRIHVRACLSNSWREQDADMAKAILQGGTPPEFFTAQQLLLQRRLGEEARRLALEDKELGEAVLNLGRAKLALARRTDQEERVTAWRQVPSGADGLPYEAAQMFEVRVGDETWAHLLTERTFAFASVTASPFR